MNICWVRVSVSDGMELLHRFIFYMYSSYSYVNKRNLRATFNTWTCVIVNSVIEVFLTIHLPRNTFPSPSVVMETRRSAEPSRDTSEEEKHQS